MNTRTEVDATITDCVMLDRHGEPCDKPGEPGLPAGICAEHAITVFRAVSKLLAMHGGSR